LLRPLETAQRPARALVELADSQRRLARRPRHQPGPPVGPPLLDRAAELGRGQQALGVVDARHRPGVLGLGPVARLDFMLEQRPAEWWPQSVDFRRTVDR